jgi:hypothetical protein
MMMNVFMLDMDIENDDAGKTHWIDGGYKYKGNPSTEGFLLWS